MEKVKNIFINSNEIRETETFKKLSRIQQKINMTRTSRIAIQHAVNVCLNVGVDVWLKQTNGSWFHQQVVQEIVKKKQSC